MLFIFPKLCRDWAWYSLTTLTTLFPELSLLPSYSTYYPILTQQDRQAYRPAGDHYQREKSPEPAFPSQNLSLISIFQTPNGSRAVERLEIHTWYLLWDEEICSMPRGQIPFKLILGDPPFRDPFIIREKRAQSPHSILRTYPPFLYFKPPTVLGLLKGWKYTHGTLLWDEEICSMPRGQIPWCLPGF